MSDVVRYKHHIRNIFRVSVLLSPIRAHHLSYLVLLVVGTYTTLTVVLMAPSKHMLRDVVSHALYVWRDPELDSRKQCFCEIESRVLIESGCCHAL